MYKALWLRIGDIFKASLFGRFFLSVCTYISNAFKASYFYAFFADRDMGSFAQNAAIPRFIRKLFFEGFISKIISQSFFINFICDIPKKVMSAPLSVISCYLVPSSLILFFRSYGNIPRMIAFSLLFIIGIILIRFKTTVGTIIKSSFVLGKFCDFFDIKTDYLPNQKPVEICVLAAFSGTIAGCASFIGGDMIMFAAFAGLLFFPFLLASPLLLITITIFAGISLSTFPAVALSLLTFVVVLCRVFCKIEKLPDFRPIYILGAMYFVLTLYHVFVGFAGSDSILAAIIQLSLMLLFFSVTIVVNNRDIFKKLIFSITTCTLYTSAVGLAQFVFGKGGMGWSDNEEYVGGLSRITSTFANPNVYGEFLIITICISFIAVVMSKTFIQRLFFIGCFLLQVVNLALTYSRGCYIAVALAAFIVVWCCDKRLLTLGVFAVPILPYVLPQNMLTRLLSVGSYFKDTSVSYRMSIWKAAFKIVKNHWFIGSGIGTAAFTAFYLDYMIPGVDAQHSHNWFMQITIEMSIVALIILLLIMFYTVKDVSFIVKNTGTLECKLAIIPLFAAMCGVFVEGFVDYIFYNNIIYMMFWTLIALMVCILNIYDAELKRD